MYYWIGEYELARKHCQQGVDVIEQIEGNWSYETVRQHLGRALVKVGEYDKAHEILERTAASPVLQSPYYQTRTSWSLSDFYLSIGERDKGMEYAHKARKLCNEYQLRGQGQIIANILTQHRIRAEEL